MDIFLFCKVFVLMWESLAVAIKMLTIPGFFIELQLIWNSWMNLSCTGCWLRAPWRHLCYLLFNLWSGLSWQDFNSWNNSKLLYQLLTSIRYSNSYSKALNIFFKTFHVMDVILYGLGIEFYLCQGLEFNSRAWENI